MMPPLCDMMFPTPNSPFRAGSWLIGSNTTTQQNPGVLPPFSSHASTLRGIGRPVGRFNPELLGVLGVQPLPTSELHGIGADYAANGSSAEQVIQDIETNVPPGSAHCDEALTDVGPQRQARAATKGFEFPPHIVATPLVLKRLGSVGSRHCCFGNAQRGRAHRGELHRGSNRTEAPIGVEWSHSRRCAGSVRACQTFSGEWRSSRTRMSVHLSSSFCP